MALEIKSVGGMCPCQAEGVWDDQSFYFRARWGAWTIEIGATPDDAVSGELVAEGEDSTGGWMSEEDAIKIVNEVYAKWSKKGD